MIITYEEFCTQLLDTIHTGEDFYKDLLNKVINDPRRYCGLFRLSNAKTKLIQNVTQSNEIKFGDLIENIVTNSIEKLGYTNFDKNLGLDSSGNNLNVDQYFTDGNIIYIVEMKIRDDHDSTKKRGQYDNFRKKISLIISKHPGSHIDASMWFVDDGFDKNKKYYLSEISKEKYLNCSLHLYYGNEFLLNLKNGSQVWDELIEILKQYRKDNSSIDVKTPDFGCSEEILGALLKLSDNKWKVLTSQEEKYILLREELFSGGNNIEKARILRNEKKS
jgi:hypothetical protein